MRLLFMGSGPLACPALKMLAERRADEVMAVVTRPDRPRGRHLRPAPCPAKAQALSLGLKVMDPEQVNDPEVVEQLAGLAPDLIVVADYGEFLRPALLDLAPRGAINLHPSLLPKYRGAAPIQWAIANGETETGVTVLHVSERMDAGDIIFQERVPIHEEDTALSLAPLLASLGATLLARALDALREGRAPRIPQDEAGVTLAPKLKKEDGRIHWSWPATMIRNRIRGFLPWPGCFTDAPAQSGRLLKILRATIELASGPAGRVLECGDEGPLVACGQDALRLREVQPEGGRPMSGGAYLRGHPLKPGDLLG